MTDTPIYRLERRFDAQRALVWRAWTEPELLARWYGPTVETLIHELDVRPGGLWRTEMKMGEHGHFERTEYLEVVAPERLVWLQSMAGPDFERMANPMMPDWPRVLKAVVTFADEGARTHVVFTWEPHEARDAEKAMFAQAMSGRDLGWASGMDKLAEVLADLV